MDLEQETWKLVVKCEGETLPVSCEWLDDGLEVTVEGKGEPLIINTDWRPGEPMMLADVDGKEVAVQVRQYFS